ncbi:MAG: response regulator [Xenococcaceae cyanobacterium]
MKTISGGNNVMLQQLSTVSLSADKKLHPINLLEQLSRFQADGCLQVSSGSVDWLIYFNQGKLTYATNSVDPFERLERHLRRLSYEVATLTSDVRMQVTLNFETKSQNNLSSYSNEYQAICWLLEQQYIKDNDAVKLVGKLTEEVFELYLSLSDFDSKNFIASSDIGHTLCHFQLGNLIEKCQNKLQAWQALGPQIWSPYQRPYFSIAAHDQPNLSSEQVHKLGKLLRGFSFRQLAVLLNQDALKLAQRLSPLIRNQTIILRDPQHPFDQLPKISNYSLNKTTRSKANLLTENNADVEKLGEALAGVPKAPGLQKTCTIACIDDSPTILNEIKRFLDQENFSVFTISDSLKALMKIIKIKPDLILMDVGMPNLDGYNLCSMLRKYPLFKKTPIVMVTGNKSIIDRAKAKFVGATDYLTKPFTQSELLKIVFRYLT